MLSCATCFILFLASSCAFSVAILLTLTCFQKHHHQNEDRS
ncbi:hypothetical protein PROPEN_01690 [Proteus penneri ATCC 35198]|nr:hypothetical protein PROPEN_01690 [Proteus penneri ATCC 35198]